ncbi:MAG: CsbD family protein [Wenzhouxiangella sp.]
MNKDQAHAQWDRLSAKVKQNWGDLTDDEIKQAEGNLDELIARIREKYGDSKEAVAEKINQLMKD